MVNVMALDGDASQWADQLARIASDLLFTTMFVGVPDQDPIASIRRLGEEVAPRVRELLG